MEIVRFTTAKTYSAAGHEEVVARRLQGGEASSASFVLVGHSTVPDGATIPRDAGAIDKIYVIVTGTLAIDASDGTTHVLCAGDSIFIPAGEARRVRNASGIAAAMVVITPPVA